MSVLKITFSDKVRNGVAKSGNAYCFQDAYLHLETEPFPVKVQLFVDNAFSAGDYLVPYSLDVRNERLGVYLNLEGAKRV